MAVVEVIENNLPFLHLLILVQFFMSRCLAFFDEAMNEEPSIPPAIRHLTVTFPGNSGVWKVHFPEDLLKRPCSHRC